MPSPFTSSFASAAAGNNFNEGSNGRNTGSGDWYVILVGRGESPRSAPAQDLQLVELILVHSGHALERMEQPKHFVDLLPPPFFRSNEMLAKPTQIHHLQVVASTSLHIYTRIVRHHTAVMGFPATVDTPRISC